MHKDSLGDRMKLYESVSRNSLMRKTPVIIRIDGKCFSSFCKRFEKPYDEVLHFILNNVMKHLCGKIQCVKYSQRHSDEMSFLLTDYDSVNTDPYFEYNVQKITSVVAGMATAEFCKQLVTYSFIPNDWGEDGDPISFNKRILQYDEDWPVFDCRCFNVPEDDIPNYFFWRLMDCVRGSINMLAQSKFSHKELQGISNNQMQEMLFQKCGINWNNLPQYQKTGYICVKETVTKPIENGPKKGELFERRIWNVIPAPRNLGELRGVLDKILFEINV